MRSTVGLPGVCPVDTSQLTKMGNRYGAGIRFRGPSCRWSQDYFFSVRRRNVGATTTFAHNGCDGRYKLSIPAYPGRVRLCAVKESAGYPDTQGLLFSSPTDNMPEVSLTAGAAVENVDIRLGLPDGVLDTSMIDARSGAPVTKARITWRREDPYSYYSASQYFPDGHFSFALPPVPIYIAVDAPGYAHWTYEDPITGNPYLLLPANRTKVFVVTLFPQ